MDINITSTSQTLKEILTAASAMDEALDGSGKHGRRTVTFQNRTATPIWLGTFGDAIVGEGLVIIAGSATDPTTVSFDAISLNDLTLIAGVPTTLGLVIM